VIDSQQQWGVSAYRPQGGAVSNQSLHPTDQSSENRSLKDKNQCLNIYIKSVFGIIFQIIVHQHILKQKNGL